MDRNNDFPGFNPYDSINNGDINSFDMYKDPMMFNPIMQYEQATAYYRYLCMQMDYKIKCKEYEKMCEVRSDSPRKSEKEVRAQ